MSVRVVRRGGAYDVTHGGPVIPEGWPGTLWHSHSPCLWSPPAVYTDCIPGALLTFEGMSERSWKMELKVRVYFGIKLLKK